MVGYPAQQARPAADAPHISSGSIGSIVAGLRQASLFAFCSSLFFLRSTAGKQLESKCTARRGCQWGHQEVIECQESPRTKSERRTAKSSPLANIYYHDNCAQAAGKIFCGS